MGDREMMRSEPMEEENPRGPQSFLQWAFQTWFPPAAQAQPGPGPVSGTLLPARPSVTAAAALAPGLWGGPNSGPAE